MKSKVFDKLLNQWQHSMPMAISAMILIAVNILVSGLDRGWGSWLACLPALIIIQITAVARAYDIKEYNVRGFIRKLGLVLAGTGAFSVMIGPFAGSAQTFPSWYGVTLLSGFSLVWMTTPHMPPWWRYISGEYKNKKGQKV